MIREDIYFMAKQAGIDIVKQHDSDTPPLELLMRFAKLVAEYEREACAMIASNKFNDTYTKPNTPKDWWNKACLNIVGAIRARK